MRELKRKSFATIFAILSLVLFVTLIAANVQNYNRESSSIKRNLEVFEQRRMMRAPGDSKLPPKEKMQDGFDPEQMMIMDHEVYSVELSDNKVSRIICHGNASDDFDVSSVADKILSTEKPGGEKIGNLFLSGYSYNYRHPDKIVIINNSEAAGRVRSFLLISICLFAAFESLFAWVSKLITDWIVRPAQESFAKQREFIADASHELKTPVAVIMASADELAAGSDVSDSGKLIGNIRYEADRMSRLITQLLDLSKLDEKVKVSYEREDLSKIVEKTALAYEAVAFEEGVGITTDIEKDVFFVCSREEIEKMVSTVIDNAVKHSYKDTTVSVSLSRSKGNISIKIINKGDPIPPGEEEKIFERFYRGDVSRNRKDNRYGLGLAIASSIAAKHNGQIKARSHEGSTEFEIKLKDHK